MNKIFKNIGLLALTGILFTACNEDDNTNNSIVDYSKATVTLSTSSPTMIDESAISDVASTYQIEIMASLSEPLTIDAIIDLVQTGGSADSADFEGSTITIPAGSTSAWGTVDVLQTGDIEGNETLIIGGSSRANLNIATFAHNVTINNDFINTAIDLEITWDGQVVIEVEDVSSITAELCAIDLDFKLFDALTFADLGYILATGSCPEHDAFAFADGEYLIIAEMYDNPHAGFGDTSDIPMTINYEHEYFSSGSLTAAGGFDLTATAGQAPIARLNVSNGGQTYEVLPY